MSRSFEQYMIVQCAEKRSRIKAVRKDLLERCGKEIIGTAFESPLAWVLPVVVVLALGSPPPLPRRMWLVCARLSGETLRLLLLEARLRRPDEAEPPESERCLRPPRPGLRGDDEPRGLRLLLHDEADGEGEAGSAIAIGSACGIAMLGGIGLGGMGEGSCHRCEQKK